MVEVIIFWCIIISFIWLITKCWAGFSRKVVALDTEMVGAGPRGSVNMLARVSVVDRHGKVIYDEYVKPLAPVTDYRTPWSGIRARALIGAKDFHSVRQEVARILKGSILVGHDLKFDLEVLSLVHPVKDTRDTALFRLYKPLVFLKPSLKYLAREYLRRYIQVGAHCSVEDARAAMDLYLLVEEQWETDFKRK